MKAADGYASGWPEYENDLHHIGSAKAIPIFLKVEGHSSLIVHYYPLCIASSYENDLRFMSPSRRSVRVSVVSVCLFVFSLCILSYMLVALAWRCSPVTAFMIYFNLIYWFVPVRDVDTVCCQSNYYYYYFGTIILLEICIRMRTHFVFHERWSQVWRGCVDLLPTHPHGDAA